MDLYIPHARMLLVSYALTIILQLLAILIYIDIAAIGEEEEEDRWFGGATVPITFVKFSALHQWSIFK